MAEKTYNTGRVVGWSTYEEFLKETGYDPNVITNYIYNTLVTYGVTRIVELAADGWIPSHGGKFYVQTVKVSGASWGAVPIVGLDYEHYLDVFTEPKKTSDDTENVDVTDKNAIEEAIGNVFGVYVSDENGKKSVSSVSPHGYLTFMAHPDILKFQENIQGMDNHKLKLIVRGLSMENLDVGELYFGPQGFLFAGNGLIEDCYHKTVNINNLMLMASSYIELAITGNASSDGAAYTYYENATVQLEGVMAGYVDIDFLKDEGYLMTDAEIASYLEAAKSVGVAVTTAAYDKISVKSDYYYMIYGSMAYTNYPKTTGPLYVLCIRKSDGYTGLGVMLGYGTQATLGYDPNNPDNPPEKRLNMLYKSGTGENRVVTLKDKFMPDYLGAYWGKSNGWTGPVCYLQQNSLMEVEWANLKLWYNNEVTFTDKGRNSYITCKVTAESSVGRIIRLGDLVLIKGSTNSNEDGSSIRGMYVCTESHNTDSDSKFLVLSRRGGYLRSNTITSGPLNLELYTRLPQWSYTLNTPTNAEPYLLANFSDSNRIYQNELIYVSQPGPPNIDRLDHEWQVVNIATNNNPDLIVRTSAAFPLKDATSNVSTYSGDKVDKNHTNAIKISNLEGLFPTDISVQANPFTAGTSSYTISRGGNADKMTNGTIVSLKHTVTGTFGYNKDYWYQYLGKSSNAAILACSVSQKDGTNFYTLAGLTSHLNQGFPRSKQDIPNSGGSYYYNYPKVVSRMTVAQFFEDFGLNIEEYLHPDFRGTSMLKFLQNLVVYKHLGKSASTSNKKQLGFDATYRFFTKAAAKSITETQPTELKPVTASLKLYARTDPDSFTSPGFFTAFKINPTKSGTSWSDNPSGESFNISNPDYPIWATIAKSRNGEQTMSVSLIDDEGIRLNDSGSEGTIEADTVTPHDWLVGLALGKSIDVLRGMRVQRTQSNCNYLITADGTRLYISKDEPKGDDILDGSIGIGW